MSLTRSDVEKLAQLAKISITDQEVELYQKDLDSVLTYVGMIGSLTVEGVEEMARVDETPHMRTDVPVPLDSPESLVKSAPEVVGGFIISPSVRDE